MHLGANAYTGGDIFAQIPAGYSVNAAGFLVRDADGAIIGTAVINPDGSIAGWVDKDGNRIGGYGFGGYNPNLPPPGYDPLCWRATNWDRDHGLSCRVNVSTGETVLENVPIRSWLPWTVDMGGTPPPSGSLYAYLEALGEVLPHPGPMSWFLSRALYDSVRDRAADMTADEFLAEVARLRQYSDFQLNVIIGGGDPGPPQGSSGAPAPTEYVEPVTVEFEPPPDEPIIGPGEVLLPGGEVVPIDYVPPPSPLGPLTEGPPPPPAFPEGPFIPVDLEDDYVPPVYTGPILPPPGLAPPVPTDILPEEPMPGAAPEAPATSKVLYAAALGIGIVLLLGSKPKR